LRQIVGNLESVPGVRDVAFTSALPLQGWGYGMPFQISDRPVVDRAYLQACFFKMVSPSYFRAVGMRLREAARSPITTWPAHRRSPSSTRP
jgi:putative ABC transport system permease protein